MLMVIDQAEKFADILRKRGKSEEYIKNAVREFVHYYGEIIRLGATGVCKSGKE